MSCCKLENHFNMNNYEFIENDGIFMEEKPMKCKDIKCKKCDGGCGPYNSMHLPQYDLLYRPVPPGCCSLPKNEYEILHPKKCHRIFSAPPYKNPTLAFRSKTGICPLGWYAGENNMCYPAEEESEGMFYKC